LDRLLTLIINGKIDLIIERTDGLLSQSSQFENRTPAEISTDFNDTASFS
jgi:hypothetical protein